MIFEQDLYLCIDTLCVPLRVEHTLVRPETPWYEVIRPDTLWYALVRGGTPGKNL
jgi:hypothetical protein